MYILLCNNYHICGQSFTMNSAQTIPTPPPPPNLLKHPLPSSPFAAAYHQTDWPLGSSHAASDVKLCLPLFDPSGTPICTCCHHLHPFGDHIFDFAKLGLITQFTKLCHYPLAPLLSTAGYLPPTSKLDIKPLLYLPPDPHARPFIL